MPGNGELIKKIIRYNSSIKHLSAVIYLSSIIIENKALLYNFAENLEILLNSGLSFIIVHDYKTLVSKQFELLGVEGESYSVQLGDERMADLLEMIISGYINKRLVSALCCSRMRAVGFSGKDGDLVIARKTRGTEEVGSLIEAHFGEPLIINPEILFEIEETSMVPIISPVARSERGRTLILDAAMTAAMIAASVDAHRLIMMCEDDFLIRQVGFLASAPELDSLFANNAAVTRRNPLIRASRHALLNSGASVYFADSQKPDSLLFSVFSQF